MKKELREEFWKSFENSPYVMIRLESGGGHSEPMTAQLDRDAHHMIWFFTSRGNRIAAGGRAMAQFIAKGHDLFACLSGTLMEEVDQTMFDRHWSRAAEAWFAGGREDPNVMMLRFEIDNAEVWTADPGVIGKFKLLTGSKVSAEEIGEHAVGIV